MNNLKRTYNKRALTLQEAAEYACVSRATVENWLSNELMPFEELPSRGKGSYCFRRIRKTDLDDFINKYYRKFSQSEKSNKSNESNELILLPRDS